MMRIFSTGSQKTFRAAMRTAHPAKNFQASRYISKESPASVQARKALKATKPKTNSNLKVKEIAALAGLIFAIRYFDPTHVQAALKTLNEMDFQDFLKSCAASSK